MRNARWITKATNTKSEYAILITFAGKQWLHAHNLILCYTSTA